jgi:HD-GYP domain-containing protein (c-di-GMP phosphodiesterase class II)
MSRADHAYPIHPSQLVVGLSIWVDMPWLDHPFMRSRLMLTTQAEVDEVQAVVPEGCLYWYPGRSRATPLPRPVAKPEPSVEQAPEVDAEKALALRRERELVQLKQLTQAARKAWDNMSMSVWALVHDMPRSPVSVGQKACSISFDVVEGIGNASSWQLRKLADSSSRGQHHHALRTMTLSAMIGTQLGMSRHDLTDLVLAALVHDSGQADVPYPAVHFSGRPDRAGSARSGGGSAAIVDRERLKQHVQLGVKLAEMTGVFSPEALQIVAQHHVAMDGSGWPVDATEACLGARVLALADRFDRLCTPASRDDPPMSPSSAILHLFQREGRRFDPTVLQALVKLMGMYPPSTILRLSDGSTAMVVAPGTSIHQPLIATYDRNVLPQEAALRVLGADGCPTVVSSVSVVGLPAVVVEWLEKIELRMAATPVVSLHRQILEGDAELETQGA